jgi:predicted Zn-dependent protease
MPVFGGGQRPQSSITGRLLLAVMIAVVGWIVYMNQVEENPVTGKKQHVAMSPKQEIRLGLESAPSMAREMGGEVPASDIRAQAVQKMGQYLVDHSVAKKSPWQFKFHLLADSKTVNAFALPGGQIFITLGLYNDLENEAELAGVLGHEMGHVIERHSAQQMATNQLGQVLVTAVATGASDQGGGGYGPAVIASVVNQMFQLRYSRGDESQADTWGIQIMEEAGFNPEALIQVMKVLKNATAGRGGGSTPEIFQTHPNPDLRIEQIQAYLKEHPAPSNLTMGGKLPKTEGNGKGIESLFDLLR